MLWLCLPLLAFASGVLVGRLSVRRYRHDRIAWAQRRLQLKVLSLELKSLRSKVVSAQGRRTPPAKRRLARKLPMLKWWQRRLIAWLRLYFPWLTRFMRFSPGTYIRWLQAKSRKGHAMKIAEGKSRGRPPTPQFVVDAIVAIKRDHPRYSAGHMQNGWPSNCATPSWIWMTYPKPSSWTGTAFSCRSSDRRFRPWE